MASFLRSFILLCSSAMSILVCLACTNPTLISWRLGQNGSLNKMLEELKGVNETMHTNLKQFSLLPYCEDTQVLIGTFPLGPFDSVMASTGIPRIPGTLGDVFQRTSKYGVFSSFDSI
jgi:hypothetical protein